MYKKVDNFLIFSVAVDNLKIQVASVKSRIERAMKQPGFDAKEAASLTRQMDELNRWTQKLIELPEDSSGLLKINTLMFLTTTVSFMVKFIMKNLKMLLLFCNAKCFNDGERLVDLTLIS